MGGLGVGLVGVTGALAWDLAACARCAHTMHGAVPVMCMSLPHVHTHLHTDIECTCEPPPG